jgi:hypothetical protein
MGRESSHGELAEGSVPSTAPAILYRPSEQGDVEVVVHGESVLVPLYDPHLLFDATSRIANLMEAQRRTAISSMGDIHLNPGEINVHGTDIDLRANGRVSALSQYIYSPTGERIGVEQVHLEKDVVFFQNVCFENFVPEIYIHMTFYKVGYAMSARIKRKCILFAPHYRRAAYKVCIAHGDINVFPFHDFEHGFAHLRLVPVIAVAEHYVFSASCMQSHIPCHTDSFVFMEEDNNTPIFFLVFVQNFQRVIC